MISIIRIVGRADNVPSPNEGKYVVDFNPDAKNGYGEVKVSPDSQDAKHFGGYIEAHDYWTQQSKVRPFRSDGKPNRPLTAYNVEIVPYTRVHR